MNHELFESLVFKDIKNDINIFEKTYKLPLSFDIGSFFLKENLHSKGNDFTNELSKIDPQYKGTSHLKRLYMGKVYESTPSKNYDFLKIWTVMKNNNPIGIIAFEHCQDEIFQCPTVNYDYRRKPKEQIAVINMGMLSCFLKKEYRKLGIMKNFFKEYLVPYFEEKTEKLFQEKKAMPYLIAADATWELIRKAEIPLIPITTVSINQNIHIWREYHELFMLNGMKTIGNPFQIKKTDIVYSESKTKSKKKKQRII
jgi:hypothetical protein